MRTALELITTMDLDSWTKQDFAEVIKFLNDSGYTKNPTEDMLSILSQENYKRIIEAEENYQDPRLSEVYQGYNRAKLKTSVALILKDFTSNISNPDNCSDLTKAAMNMHKSIRFPATSKVNPVPMPTVVPRALEYLHRRRAMEGKPAIKLPILKDFRYTNSNPLESIGDPARPEHLAEFLATAPYHWLEFWATARVNGGEICFPNTLVAALLFEQKFGYLPDFLPESDLNQELKKRPRPSIHTSWARQGFIGKDNSDLKRYATPASIFEVQEDVMPEDIWD